MMENKIKRICDPLTIYDPSGNEIMMHSLSPNCTRKFSLMSEDSVTLRFHLKEGKRFPVGSSVSLPEGDFVITKEQPGKWNAATGVWEYELKFDAYYWAWANKLLRYIIKNEDSSKDLISSPETSFVLTATIDVHASVIMNCLDYLGMKYDGSPFGIDTTDTSLSSEAKLVRYENLSLLGGIQAVAEAFDCEWWVKGSKVYFGRCEHQTEENYEFEAGVNVSSITFNQGKSETPNRIYVFGSDRNLPPDYRKTDGNDTINGVVLRRLMLPEGTPYLQTEKNLPEAEIVEQVVVLDDVYPKTDLTVSEVPEPYTAEGQDEEGNTIKETFYRIKYGNAFRFSESYILPNEELHIVFQSGLLNGMDFGAKFNPKGVNEKNAEDWNPDAQMIEIVANEDYGRKLPDNILKPQKGDKFILYGWDSTKMANLGLITKAEGELLDEGKKVLEEYTKDLSTCTCPMAWDYMQPLFDANKEPKPGDVVTIIDCARFGDEGRKSRIIGFEYKLDKPYAEWTYTCGENVSVSRLKSLEQKIEGLTKSGTKVQMQNSLDFLSKRYADRTPYLLGSNTGFDIGEFLGGVSGGRFAMDKETRQSFLEVDRLYARVRAYFESLTVVEAEALAGRQYITPGGGVKCTKVEEVINEISGELTGWKCYFLSEQDGEKFYTKIKAGDQVICEDFNIEPGTIDKVSNRRWWRFVNKVENDAYTDGNTGNHYGYIEVSATDCELDSDTPAVGDEIVQLGSRLENERERQSAIVISTVGTDAPSVKLLSGIKSFSIDDTDIISYGYDSNTAGAYFNCYGKFFFGPRDESSYLKFDPSDQQLIFKGKLSLDSSVGDDETLEDYVEKVAKSQNNYVLDMDNEIAGVACNSSGTVTGQLPSTNLKVFKGGSQDSGWTFKIANSGAVGCTASLTGTVLKITSLSSDNASVTVEATKTNYPTLTAVMNVYKVKPGATGAAAVVYSIVPSVDNISKSMTGELSANSVTCSVYKTTGNSSRVLTSEKTLSYQRIDNGEVTASGDLTHSNGTSTAVNILDTTEAVIFELKDGSTVLDRERVPVISDASDLELGGRNLLLHSNDGVVNSKAYNIRNFPISDIIKPIENEVYTFTLWGELGVGKTVFRVFNSRGNIPLASLTKIADGKYQAVFKWTNSNGVGATIEVPTHIEIYTIPNFDPETSNPPSTIHRVKLEKGNVGTDWTPAPEDIEETVATFDYLKEALKGTTEINGGLILSSLIKLGTWAESGDKAVMSKVYAGMNGSVPSSGTQLQKDRTIASWWGGDIIDRFNTSNGVISPVPANAAAALVRMDGSAYFSKGNIGFNADGGGWLGGQDKITFEPNGKMTFGSGIVININGERGLRETLESIVNFQNNIDKLLEPCDASGNRLEWKDIVATNGEIKAKSLKAKVGFWSESFISALGLNSSVGGSGGGFSYGLVKSWMEYSTAVRDNNALSAGLGYDIYSNMVTKDSAQDITGVKTFSAGLKLTTSNAWDSGDRAIPFSQANDTSIIRYYSVDSNKGLTFNSNTGALKAASFVKRGGTSSQFLKADGSVDSTSYLSRTGGSMSNTTVVTNLNADLLDGQHNGEVTARMLNSTTLPADTSVSSLSQKTKVYHAPSSGEYAFNVILSVGEGATRHFLLMSSRGDGVNASLKWRGVNEDAKAYGEIRTIVDSLNISGYNAGSATKLQTSRNIWGQPFDGTGNVSGSLTNVGGISMSSGITQTLSANNWAVSMNSYSPNMTTDNRVVLRLGKTGNTLNTGYISYHHKSDGSSTNFISLGLWGKDEIFNVLGSGNVGIGTTSPSHKLSVVGNANVSTELYVGTNIYTGGKTDPGDGKSGVILTRAGSIELCGDPPFIDFHFNKSDSDYTSRIIEEAAGQLKVDGTLHVTNGLYSDSYISARGQNTTSDMRIKERLEDIDLSIRSIAETPIFRFRFLDTDKQSEGTSAQYMEGVLPTTVSEQPDGLKALDYGRAAFIYAVTEAREIERLRKRIEELERIIKEKLL